jgi:hypothetical protein
MSLTCVVFITTAVIWWWGLELQMLTKNLLALVRCRHVWSRVFVGFQAKYIAPTYTSATDFYFR